MLVGHEPQLAAFDGGVAVVHRDRLEAAGLLISGTSPDRALVEFVELAGHPYYVATQSHPEFRSRPGRAHPLFAGLVGAAIQRRKEST